MVRSAYAGSTSPANTYGTCRPSTGAGPPACVLMTQRKSIFWAISTRILSGKSGLEPHLADFQFRSDWQRINLCNECSYAYEGGVALMRLLLMPFFLSPKNRE